MIRDEIHFHSEVEMNPLYFFSYFQFHYRY